MRYLSYLTAFHDRRMLNSTLAENALTECKKIKAVTRIAAQVCKRCASLDILLYILYSTSAMGDKGANKWIDVIVSHLELGVFLIGSTEFRSHWTDSME